MGILKQIKPWCIGCAKAICDECAPWEKNVSDTPRTDAVALMAEYVDATDYVVPVDHARQLERQLSYWFKKYEEMERAYESLKVTLDDDYSRS